MQIKKRGLLSNRVQTPNTGTGVYALNPANASVTAITAAQNTGGLIVETITVTGSSGSNAGIAIFIDDVAVWAGKSPSIHEIDSMPERLLLRPGEELKIQSQSDGWVVVSWTPLA